MEEIKSEVSVKKAGGGYFVEVKDQFSENRLAVTREELEMIVLYGQEILENEPLLCTANECRELQDEDGEFCKKHYPINKIKK